MGNAHTPKRLKARISPPDREVRPGVARDPSSGDRYHRTDHSAPGIRRLRVGTSFRYVLPNGRRLKDPKTLERIRSLAIPPAWEDVWISPDPDGHIQSTGRDARGRKQYRYHKGWRELREGWKYDRITVFARALPGIRSAVEADLRRKDLDRDKVLAAIVCLMDLSSFRVGNKKYARTNGSYGLTTFCDHHVRCVGSQARIRFQGKSGKKHEVEIRHALLVPILRRCRDLPGRDLFQCVDQTGRTRVMTSHDVNDYLRRASGEEVTAKDFRTWNGTVRAAIALHDAARGELKLGPQRQILQAIRQVAVHLGNTPSVCRASYIHPGILQRHMDGSLSRVLGGIHRTPSRQHSALSAEEAAVLKLLCKGGSRRARRLLQGATQEPSQLA